jgi:hypothetical protein
MKEIVLGTFFLLELFRIEKIVLVYDWHRCYLNIHVDSSMYYELLSLLSILLHPPTEIYTLCV